MAHQQRKTLWWKKIIVNVVLSSIIVTVRTEDRCENAVTPSIPATVV